MNLIEDVKSGLRELDTSKGSLRRFAFFVGTIFLIISFWIWLQGYVQFLCYFIGSLGILLIITGIFFPSALKNVYIVWMGIAFANGWFISRILLILIFYFVMLPIGLVARLLGKEFLDIEMKKERESYWIKRDMGKKTDYEKMY